MPKPVSGWFKPHAGSAFRVLASPEELERRFHYPSCARIPCMLLYGDSGMGETMILEKMERQHPDSYDERRGITKRPVLIIQMPASPDERRFYTRILEVLGGAPPAGRHWLAQRRFRGRQSIGASGGLSCRNWPEPTRNRLDINC